MTTYLSPRDPEGDRLRAVPLTTSPRLLFQTPAGGASLDRDAVIGLRDHLTRWLRENMPTTPGPDGAAWAGDACQCGHARQAHTVQDGCTRDDCAAFHPVGVEPVAEPAGVCGLCRGADGEHAPWCIVGQAQRQGSGQ